VRYATFFHIPTGEGARRAHALLERFGIAAKANDLVETLSGGMRRRLQVARALISHPRVLVLDEPTTGLDPEMRHGVWQILAEERAQGVAILLSTHYMEEAERLCDRVALIDHGRIVELDSPQRLIEQYGTENLEDVYLMATSKSKTDP
jgi:lipooligosaccharide transport system ATP-binding protein